jgi:hypothetical protein
MNIQSFSQVAPSFDYKANINTEVLRVESSAQQIHVEVEANNSSYYPGSTMVFQFPSAMNLLADMERSFLTFNVGITDNTSGTKTLSLADDGSSVINSLEVFVNNVSLGAINNYNGLKSIMNGITVPSDVRSGPLSVYAGFGQKEPTSSTYDTQTVSCQLTLDSLFGKTSRLLPMFLLNNVEVRVRLEQVHVALVKVGAGVNGPTVPGTTYTITNPVMQIFGKQLNDVDRNTLTQKFLKEGMMISTTAWEYYPVNWTGSVGVVSLDTRKQSVKSALVAFRSNTLLDTNKFAATTSIVSPSDVGITSGNKLLCTDGRVKKYYWQVGSDRFPQNYSIESRSEAAIELHNFAHGQITGYRVTPELWNNTTGNSCFVLARDFETSHTGSLVSGLSNSAKQKSDIKIRIEEIYGSPSANVTGDAWIHFDRVIHISPRGDVKIVE